MNALAGHRPGSLDSTTDVIRTASGKPSGLTASVQLDTLTIDNALESSPEAGRDLETEALVRTVTN